MLKKGFLNSPAATETRPLLGRPPPVPRAPASQLSVDKFALERYIGRGNFCEVFEALPLDKSLFDGKPIALKIFDRHRVAKLQKARDVIMERHCMLRLNDPGHPNIIRLLGTFKDEDRVCLIYELAENGELWDCVRYGGVASEALATRYVFSLGRAIEYMHNKGIVHRDIKAENIVLMRDGNIKVIDFGTAVDQEHPEVQPAVLGAVPPLDLRSQNNRRGGCAAAARPSFAHHVGTPQFMSPEAVQNKDSGRLRDLWSLGCTIYQIFTGYPPFDASTNYFVFLRVQSRDLQFPPGFPVDAKQLVEQLLASDPHARLGATEGMKDVWLHPFFTTRLHRLQQQLLHSGKRLLLQHGLQKETEEKQKQQQERPEQQESEQQQQQPPKQQREEAAAKRRGPEDMRDLGENAQQHMSELEEELQKLLQQIEGYMARTPAPVASLQELCLQSILRKVGELLDEEETKQLEKEAEAFHQTAAAAGKDVNAQDKDEDEDVEGGRKERTGGENKQGAGQGRRGGGHEGEDEEEKEQTEKKKKRTGGGAAAENAAAAQHGGRGPAAAAAAAVSGDLRCGGREEENAAGERDGSDEEAAAVAGARNEGNKVESFFTGGKAAVEEQQEGTLFAAQQHPQEEGGGRGGKTPQQQQENTPEQHQQQRETDQQQPQLVKKQQQKRELQTEEKKVEQEKTTYNEERRQTDTGEGEGEETKRKEDRSAQGKRAEEKEKDKAEMWKGLLDTVVGKETWERYENSWSSGRMQLLLERVKYVTRSRQKLLQWQQKLAAQWLAENNERRIAEEEEEEEEDQQE